MQRTLTTAVTLLGLSVALAGAAGAQGRGKSSSSYPPGFRPPPGMCRVWLQGVPPGRQPGVTDCAAARATAGANATVIYGDRNDDPAYRGRTGTYSRTVYDSYGNRITQQVRRNADGTISILGSTPYGVNGTVRGKSLPGVTNAQAGANARSREAAEYRRDRDMDHNENDKYHKDHKEKEHKDKDHKDKDHKDRDNDHR